MPTILHDFGRYLAALATVWGGVLTGAWLTAVLFLLWLFNVDRGVGVTIGVGGLLVLLPFEAWLAADRRGQREAQLIEDRRNAAIIRWRLFFWDREVESRLQRWEQRNPLHSQWRSAARMEHLATHDEQDVLAQLASESLEAIWQWIERTRVELAEIDPQLEEDFLETLGDQVTRDTEPETLDLATLRRWHEPALALLRQRMEAWEEPVEQ